MQEFIDILGEDVNRISVAGALLSLTPHTTEEVSAILKVCTKHRIPVLPSGGSTKSSWGARTLTREQLHRPQLDGSTVILQLGKLEGVTEHSWQDLTATVRAGTRWAEMQKVLANHGQRVAVDPIQPERAHVGGILATNDTGTLRMRYGSLRDLIIGITVVLADGTIARSGGKVVKNVAGYDLPKLFTGSFGTLGIITEATFRLHPLPQQTATFTVRSAEVAPLADLMTTILKSSLSLEQMQLRNEPLGYALDLQFASLPDVLADVEIRLRTLAGAHSIASADDDVFRARERLFTTNSFYTTVLKITALPNKLAALVAGIAHLNSLPNQTAFCVADPVGIVTVALDITDPDVNPNVRVVFPADTAPAGNPAKLAEIVDDLRSRLVASGGSVTVLRAGHLPHTVDPWGVPPAAIEVMRAIKNEFDPQHILNAGKFVGGI
ncbi:MAG TPA: FAD-binding oxidoreductase [Acidobacteriaceae bacterium]